MSRKRKPGNEWLPPYVYMGRKEYEIHTPDGRRISLCSIHASREEVLECYTKAINGVDGGPSSVADLCARFLKSRDFTNLAPSTQRKYYAYSNRVLAVFGRMNTDAVKAPHIRRYVDLRSEDAPVVANRELSFMSRMFGWAYEHGETPVNPCRGVRKNRETPRDRYITDEEYQAVYNEAGTFIKAAMEISYCCAARIGDILNLQYAQLLEEGVKIKQGKTGKTQIKRWSPRLHNAINMLIESAQRKTPNYLVTTKNGGKITYDMFEKQWQHAKSKAARKNKKLKFDFTFHDIKAKSISDYSGNKQRFSGHKTASQVAVYDRKTVIVDTLE